jgi:predicted RNA-binding Zn-ribbon protein involved in translation (DUF1610 family)
MARKTHKRDTPPTRAQAVKAVRIFGAINLALGIYMILGAITAAQGMNLPGSAARLVGGILGIVAVAVGWGSAAASGLGLILLSGWGRWLAAMWGKIVVWLLPIAYGLSADGLSDFFSLSFGIILVICLYASVVAQNVGKEEFDAAFVAVSSGGQPDSHADTVKEAPPQPSQEPAPLQEKISFECPECGKRYTVSASLAGRKAQCKACGHRQRIPSETAG